MYFIEYRNYRLWAVLHLIILLIIKLEQIDDLLWNHFDIEAFFFQVRINLKIEMVLITLCILHDGIR